MYIILEIQENPIGATPQTLVFTAATQNEAFSKWHEVLKFAAISQVARHSAVILTTEGQVLARESYVHSEVE
jgi:hypothetical protein